MPWTREVRPSRRWRSGTGHRCWTGASGRLEHTDEVQEMWIDGTFPSMLHDRLECIDVADAQGRHHRFLRKGVQASGACSSRAPNASERRSSGAPLRGEDCGNEWCIRSCEIRPEPIDGTLIPRCMLEEREQCTRVIHISQTEIVQRSGGIIPSAVAHQGRETRPSKVIGRLGADLGYEERPPLIEEIWIERCVRGIRHGPSGEDDRKTERVIPRPAQGLIPLRGYVPAQAMQLTKVEGQVGIDGFQPGERRLEFIQAPGGHGHQGRDRRCRSLEPKECRDVLRFEIPDALARFPCRIVSTDLSSTRASTSSSAGSAAASARKRIQVHRVDPQGRQIERHRRTLDMVLLREGTHWQEEGCRPSEVAPNGVDAIRTGSFEILDGPISLWNPLIRLHSLPDQEDRQSERRLLIGRIDDRSHGREIVDGRRGCWPRAVVDGTQVG